MMHRLAAVFTSGLATVDTPSLQQAQSIFLQTDM